MRALLVTFAGVLLATATSAAEFPKLTGRVVDEAGILHPNTVRALSRQLEAHENAGGNQVVVATVESLGGDSIESYGVDLGRAWGIGQEGEDNGIILLVAPAERNVRIEVGYGLEGDLPDAIASAIVNMDILPRFRQGDFNGGVAAGVTSIISALGGEYVVREPPRQPRQQRDRRGGGAFGLIWLVLIGFFVFRRGGGLLGGLLLGSVLGSVARDAHGFGGGAGGGFGGGFGGGGGSFGGGGASGSW